MLPFRSEEHVARWCRRWAQEKGVGFSCDQAWRLAKAWYSEDRRSPQWRRKTKEEAQEILDRLGLSSPFWQL
jgi:hypothetical protein